MLVSMKVQGGEDNSCVCNQAAQYVYSDSSDAIIQVQSAAILCRISHGPSQMVTCSAVAPVGWGAQSPQHTHPVQSGCCSGHRAVSKPVPCWHVVVVSHADRWSHQQLDRPRCVRRSSISQQLCSTAAAAQLGSIFGAAGRAAATTHAAGQAIQLCTSSQPGQGLWLLFSMWTVDVILRPVMPPSESGGMCCVLQARLFAEGMFWTSLVVAAVVLSM